MSGYGECRRCHRIAWIPEIDETTADGMNHGLCPSKSCRDEEEKMVADLRAALEQRLAHYGS